MSQLTPITLGLLLGGMGVFGLSMFKFGFFPRRRGSERRCRRCNYVVENISSERCPECGSVLAGRGTVLGVRTRYARLWLSGLLIFLLALTYGGMELERRVDWYHYKPARWVMEDLEARDGKTEERAWWELLHRQQAGRLSRYWEEKLADVAQKDFWDWANLPEPKRRAQIARRRGELSIIFLWDQYEAGRLTPAQTEKFFRQLTTTEWKVRPLVLVGQDIPYRLDGERYLPERTWWMKMGLSSKGNYPLTAYGTGLTGMTIGNEWVVKGSAKNTPGEYEIEIPYFFEYHRGLHPSDYEATKTAKPVWRGEFVHRAKIKVLEKPTDEYLKVIDAPDLAEAIKNSLVIDEFGFRGPHDYFGISIRSQAPPINLAFEVLGVIDGKEYHLSDVTFAKGTRGGMGSGMAGEHFVTRLKPKKMDLIFRSKPELAANTINFFDVWKGELVFKDVPVANPKQ